MLDPDHLFYELCANHSMWLAAKQPTIPPTAVVVVVETVGYLTRKKITRNTKTTRRNHNNNTMITIVVRLPFTDNHMMAVIISITITIVLLILVYVYQGMGRIIILRNLLLFLFRQILRRVYGQICASMMETQISTSTERVMWRWLSNWEQWCMYTCCITAVWFRFGNPYLHRFHPILLRLYWWNLFFPFLGWRAFIYTSLGDCVYWRVMIYLSLSLGASFGSALCVKKRGLGFM